VLFSHRLRRICRGGRSTTRYLANRLGGV